ncbi:hypothetical protein ACVIU7_004182 [Bradyrhizobium liaoningense]
MDFSDRISAEELIAVVIPGRAQREPGIHRAAELVDEWIPGSPFGRPGMTTVDSPITTETVMAVVISATAVTVVPVRNAEHALDCTDGPANAGADDAADGAAHGPADAVTFIRALLRAAHDALGMTDLRQRQQRQQDGGGEQQADGLTGRQWRGGETGFVHFRSPGEGKEVNGGGRAACRDRTSPTRRAAEWLRLCDELSTL